MEMNPFLAMSGTEQGDAIRNGEVSSQQVVSAHIEQIKRVNPKINAMVQDRFDKAMELAAEADQAVAESDPNDLPVFHGVPCSIKECLSVKGMPNASGLVSRQGIISEKDATVVERIKRSGAIVLGVTNTSELCMWMESNNRVYGRTNNPYDLSRIVGGSSGGEGAIIASGGAPFGIGSDIGGSIRMPAFFNGVFGHKPSGGLIPNTGQYPIAVNEASQYLTTGPLARHAEDLWPLIELLAGDDGDPDSGCMEIELGDPDEVEIEDLKVLVVPDNGAVPVQPEMQAALLRSADALRQAGANVEAAQFEGLKYSRDIWSAMLAAAGGPSYKELLGDGKPLGSYLELNKWLVRKSDYTLPSIMLTILELLPKAMKGRVQRAIEAGQALKDEMTERIGPNGVLLIPSFPSAAPKHYRPLIRPFDWVYTGIFNMMGLPVTQVPLGLNRGGLPLGVQVAAVHGNDHLTVAAALELEDALGGWVAPNFSYLTG
jgi:fatty acid amide hydrolase 2